MARRAIGLDVGGSSIKAARVDAQGDIEGLVQTPTPTSASVIADRCAHLAAELVSSEVAAVGIGSAGFIDREAGAHVWGPHVAGPSPMVAAVNEFTGLPAVIDNDANAAAFAELRVGAARGHSNALVVMLGSGIGGGIIIDGEVYRGSGFAGEIGHIVVDPGGPLCECERRGCWETLVSGSVLDAAATRMATAEPAGAVASLAADRRPSGEHLMLAAQGGDPGALEAWSVVGAWLGRGVAQLAVILDPEAVVVGGAPSRAGELLLGPARAALAETLHGGRVRQAPSMVVSHLGQNSAVIGAGLQALEKVDD